jgi:hypothetical protein
VAFFGGVIGVTAIAIENTRRLRAPQQVMWSIGGRYDELAKFLKSREAQRLEYLADG